jgi:hypothetical protein
MNKIQKCSRLEIVIAVAILIVVTSCAQKKDEHKHHQHSETNKQVISNYADSVNAELIPKDTLKGSPVRTAMTYVGNNQIHITYGSPGVKGRIIWGGLVAYDDVWATGAHDATSIEFSKDVMIDGQSVPAGKYGFFTIPGKENWQLILNKNWEQHLTDEYNPQDDILRTTVKPKIEDRIIQRLTYDVIKTSNTEGEIVMTWEKTRIVLPFKNSH